MKALLINRLSDDLSGVGLIDVPIPKCDAGKILVRVKAASLNYPDLLMTQGKYQFKPEPPFIAGMELAGEVVEADTASGFTPGDRVVGGIKTGAMAEYAALPAKNLRKVPDRLTLTSAAAMGVAYQTAYVALVELGQITAGQTLLVHGASGGVGLAACNLAKAFGAKVIAATHHKHKLASLRKIAQPDATILNRGRFREEVAELTDGRLCDLVFDPVGGDVFDESTRCTAFGGKLLVVGFVAGRIPQIAVNIPLIKGFSVVGVRAGEYCRRFPDRAQRILAEIDRLAVEGQITPHIDRTLPIEQWQEGFEAMLQGQVIGKVIFEP